MRSLRDAGLLLRHRWLVRWFLGGHVSPFGEVVDSWGAGAGVGITAVALAAVVSATTVVYVFSQFPFLLHWIARLRKAAQGKHG